MRNLCLAATAATPSLTLTRPRLEKSYQSSRSGSHSDSVGGLAEWRERGVLRRFSLGKRYDCHVSGSGSSLAAAVHNSPFEPVRVNTVTRAFQRLIRIHVTPPGLFAGTKRRA